MDLVKSLPAVDCTAENWQAQACELLKQHGFVRLRLNAEEMSCVRELYSAAQVAFDDGREKNFVGIAPRPLKAGDNVTITYDGHGRMVNIEASVK